jgi:hypothetical protein
MARRNNAIDDAIRCTDSGSRAPKARNIRSTIGKRRDLQCGFDDTLRC